MSTYRNAALEEAAKVCEAEADRHWPTDKHIATAIMDCAEKIRELMSPPMSPEDYEDRRNGGDR